LLFLNNDTQVTSDWLEELLKSAQEHPRVAGEPSFCIPTIRCNTPA
jgi:GT2 family glycosyltransferase